MYIAGFISKWIWGIFLYIDGIIYDVVRWVYQIFNALAKLNLFDDGSYQQIVQRIYIILGVVMLFVLAYSLLKAVINPDDFAKGEASFPNLIKNVVISLVIIAVLPTVFTFAFNVQNAILNQETIPKLILNDTGQTDINGNAIDAEYIRENGGGTIAYWTFRAFFNPHECEEGQNYTVTDPITGKTVMSTQGLNVCADNIKVDQGFLDWDIWFWNWLSTNEPNLTMVNNEVYSGRSFSAYVSFAGAVDDGQISYLFPISTIVGVVLLLILLTYCIALALRVIKLAFYQIIAPIPVIMRVLPGDKKKVFDNWVKQIIGTFIDVFIRIGILYLGVYLIQMIVNKFAMGTGATSLDALGPIQKLFAVAFLIVGVLMFVRSAPGLLKDLFGFDVGGSLNPFKIFQDATQAAAPAVGLVGGTAIGLSHGLIDRGKVNFGAGSKFANSTGLKKVWHGAGALFNTVRAGSAGAIAAGARSAYNNRNVKNLSEIVPGINKGVARTDQKTAQHIKYKADHDNSFFGSMAGHVVDFGRSTIRTLGFGSGIEELKSDNDAITEIENSNKAVGDAIKAMIEKAIAKGDYDNSFGTHFKVRQLVELDQEIKAAEGKGDVTAMRVAQDKRNRLFKDMTDEMKGIAGSSTDTIDRMTNDMKKSYADAFLAANTFRSALRKYTNKDYVKSANIGIEFLDENRNIDFANDASLKALEASMIDQRRHNNEKINRIIQKEQQNNDQGNK